MASTHLDGQVQGQQVVAEPVAADEVEIASEKSTSRCAAAASIFPLIVEIMV
jgi:hypothetical protein